MNAPAMTVKVSLDTLALEQALSVLEAAQERILFLEEENSRLAGLLVKDALREPSLSYGKTGWGTKVCARCDGVKERYTCELCSQCGESTHGDTVT